MNSYKNLFLAFILAVFFMIPALLGGEPTNSRIVQKIILMEINSSINPATLSYLNAGYDKAEKESFDMVLIKINTPGGLVSITKEILTLFGQANAPTVVWVTPEGASATSAGALIAAGAHILYMSHGTNIGAATPIQLGKDINSKDLRKKAINDLVALVRSLSNARGRNGEFFAKMIEDAASFEAKDALKKGLINNIINTEAELLQDIDGREISIIGQKVQLQTQTPNIVFFGMDFGQKVLDIFANPTMAYLFFIIGAALVYLELQAPGGFIAGGIGVLCLLLAGIGFQVLPLNFGALGLIILSFILFILEAYIVSYGILSLAGLISLIFGSLFLFRTDNAYLQLSNTLIFSAAGAIGLFIGFIGIYWFYDAKNKKVKLFYDLKGKSGTIVKFLGGPHDGIYHYHIKVTGEIWRAESATKYEVNDECSIISQDNEKMHLNI